ncbi:MAG TPA: helix-turn-helix transcriptional regulator [Mycobacteriales bacterium]|nr:helix-turn-helix transcriptional regulator [Mycobacteriales bacterium]
MPSPLTDADAVLQAFGTRLKALRTEAGMSQMTLAEASGLHPTYVSGVERGRRNVSLLAIVRLARALSQAPASLLDL